MAANANVLNSIGGGRPKIGHLAVRNSPRGIQLGESTRGRQPATKAVDQKPAKAFRKERGRKPAVKATMPAAKAADQKPTKMLRKEPGRQPATKAADLKPAKMLGRELGRLATKAAYPKLAEKGCSKEPGRKPAPKAGDAKKLAKKRKASGCQEHGDAEKLAKKAAPKPSGCQEPGVKVAGPTYWVMVKEAISALKQRRGSSQQALVKYLEENYGEGLQENFRKILSRKLKEWSKADRQLTKKKNSYKLK